MDDPFNLPPDVLRRIPLFAELSKVLSWTGGPVNWDLARQIAVSMAAGDATPPSPTAEEQAEVAEHMRVAELWLADTTSLPAPNVAARAGSPIDWAEHACDAFAELVDPVAAKIATAMSQQAGAAGGAEDADMLTQALGQMAPMFMGIQAGTILGNVAREVTGSHDLLMPTGDGDAMIVLSAVDEIAQAYSLDRALVRQWVALRSAAHRMAFDGFPRTRFFALYHNYVATLHFDFEESIRRIQELDLSDPSRLQDALGDEQLFTHRTSAESRQAASEIALFQAVVGAHITAAVASAARRIGDIGRVAETFRRREMDTGTGMQMFTSFIGLEGIPERTAADGFIATILTDAGWEALNRLWEDPEAFPTRDELQEPDAWRRRVGA